MRLFATEDDIRNIIFDASSWETSFPHTHRKTVVTQTIKESKNSEIQY